MNLVADTNALFSFFRENPVRYIILNAKSLGLEIFTPEYAIEELIDNISDLSKYTKTSENEVKQIIEELKSFLTIKLIEYFREYKEEGIKLSPDLKDSPFFALALKLEASIWSNEPRLKKQSKISVFSTSELRIFLNI